MKEPLVCVYCGYAGCTTLGGLRKHERLCIRVHGTARARATPVETATHAQVEATFTFANRQARIEAARAAGIDPIRIGAMLAGEEPWPS